MTVSVIIVTYNTRQMTAECIDSIFERTKGVDFEIILVDNASTDGSKEFFEKDSRIKYIYSSENLGFGRGNNLGYKYATGDYIFLLNSDTLLVNDAVSLFYDFMHNSPKNIGCVGCVLQNRERQSIHSYHLKFPTLSWFFQEILCFSIPGLWNPYKRDNKRARKDNYPLEVQQITGADMFIRRNVIEECGLFDPDFFMYFEETEMQHRFYKKGYSSVIIDSPEIIHLVGFSSKQNKTKFLKKYNRVMRGRFTYAKKVFNLPSYLLFRFICLMVIPRVLLSNYSMADKGEMLRILFGK